MNRLIACALFVLLPAVAGFSQAKMRKLPSSINHPGLNLYSPYMSFDGDGLVYISDNAEDNELVPFYTYREGGDWKEPSALPRTIHSGLSFLRGYTLGPEGRVLYFTSQRSPGVGGFDIWMAERRGASWTEPKNMVAPVNSKAHEGCPTIAPDGTTMYFMRCDKMDKKSASGCKLMVSTRKPNGQWNEPVELPANLNTGNSQTPRILADGETLLFSSDRFPNGKGGMDLYMSRKKNDQWSDPVALDFTNTERDDQYVSVNAQGRYLLRDSPGARKSELVEYLIPDELRPRGMLRVDGKILVETVPPVTTYVSVTDLSTSKRIFSGKPGSDGSFTVFLLEGSRYEVAVDPELGNFSYFSKLYDLTKDVPQVDRISPEIKKIQTGYEWDLRQVNFEAHTATLATSSSSELKRLSRIIQSCPEYTFEIQVLLAGLVEDSIQSDTDLTQIQIDSIVTTFDDIDSLGQLYKRDTLIVKTTYHNNRTEEQAAAILSFLVNLGVDQRRLAHFSNSRPEAIPERRRLDVRVRVK